MNMLFRVLYAAHARGTHHKLALDGLRYLHGRDIEGWRRVFLAHAELLMLGSKAPDDEFKDFTNHVLHPRDDFWGGAPAKARSWFGHVVTALRQQDWPTAVYAAGVLSHYLTDPLQPFHTAQSQAENNIHRAVEWSINRAYDTLWRLAGELPDFEIAITNADNWLETLVCDGAVEANRHYEALIAHYDFTRGVVDPPAGLDPVAQRIIAGLLPRAAASFGMVLQRAIDESGATAPDVDLTLATVLATVKIPLKVLQKRLVDAGDRRTVERMYDELQATGRVDTTLSEDDRAVSVAYAREVQAKIVPAQPSARFPYKSVEAIETTVERAARLQGENRRRAMEAAVSRVAAETEAPRAARPIAATTPEAEPAQISQSAPRPAATSGPSLVARLDAHERGLTGHQSENVPAPGPASQFYLSRGSDIVDAPSIGPKTAARLIEVGIATVGALLDADPDALARKLKVRHITPGVIRDWHDQCRLVISVPNLRGTHAQLIVGAGLRNPDALAQVDPADLSARVLAFAATGDGQRVLRNGDPPDVEAIAAWAAWAREARAAA